MGSKITSRGEAKCACAVLGTAFHPPVCNGCNKGLAVSRGMTTHLEKRLRIRPAGVVSKNSMGLRKIANAILSCSFREAWFAGDGISSMHVKIWGTCLPITEQACSPGSNSGHGQGNSPQLNRRSIESGSGQPQAQMTRSQKQSRSPDIFRLVGCCRRFR